MTYKKSVLLAIAIVVPLTLLLWLTFSPVLFVELYPGLKVQTLITAITASAQGALLGLVCGAVVNVLLYSLVILAWGRAREAMRKRE
jgi:hypothetical protein